jgi:hypothetical protein
MKRTVSGGNNPNCKASIRSAGPRQLEVADGAGFDSELAV